MQRKPNETEWRERRWVIRLCFVLGFVTLAVFWPVRHFEFTNWDDFHYVSENPVVRSGLNLYSLRWALTTTWFSYWHPLTWMSHMLDCQLFGLHAGAHHLVNVCFHIVNTLGLFLVLRQMTGATARSAMVAALFAWHPMHVESVAWIAERKDLVSTLFWIFTMSAYASYAQKPALSRYALTLGLFAAGLMAKPMVITLPCVLFLLDYWPLQRWRWGQPPPGSGPEPSCPRQSLTRLAAEKIPFFLLSGVVGAITYLGTKSAGSVLSAEVVSWSFRLGNVPVSYARYLGKLLLPEELAVLYPIPARWETWQVAGASLLVLLLSLVILPWATRRRYLVTGWLWFLGTLVPTLGLVAVGYQSIADRFTYLSYIGLFLMAVWGLADLAVAWPGRRLILSGSAAAVLLLCLLGTRLQLRHWHDSLTLWRHTIAVTDKNAVALYHLGHALQYGNQVGEAMKAYREVLRIKPDYCDAHLNLGVLYMQTGQHEAATNFFAQALKLRPGYYRAQLNMGASLCMLGNLTGATNYFAQALQGATNEASLHFNYAVALFDLGDFAGSAYQSREALRIDPGHYKAHTWLGKALSALNQPEPAQRHLLQALQLNPDFAEGRLSLGRHLLRQAQFEPAIARFLQVLRADPSSAEAHFELAKVFAAQGRSGDAIRHYRDCLEANPDRAEALNNLAWILATSPEAHARSGTEAMRLAEHACQLSSTNVPLFIGTLGAAYAEVGQFEKAITAATRARDLAQALGQTAVAEENQQLLQQFQQHQPHRALGPVK